MEVTTIEVAREQASEQYRLYSEAVKKRREPYLHDLQVLYGAMRTGKVVLDIWQSFKEAGLDANGDPKIAIARADWDHVEFMKRRDSSLWSGEFTDPKAFRHSSRYDKDANGDIVRVQIGVFDPWKTETRSERWKGVDGLIHESHPVVTIREKIRTKVPIVPVAFLPPHGLSNYHILWEVEKWDVVTPPRDPLLLKRVSPNMFVVLAAWELSDLERAVLRGRIA